MVADFDRDGANDVAALHDGSGAGLGMMVYGLNPDLGDLIAILDYQTGVAGVRAACTADVTGEGALDVLVATASAAAPFLLLPGHGDITFGEPIPTALGYPPAPPDARLACADFDGDRRADLALLRPGDGRLFLFRSLGHGLEAWAVRAVDAADVVAADMDRDGDVDLLVAGAGGTVDYLRNRGDGRFTAAMRFAVGGRPARIVAADLDYDRWPDVAVAREDGTVAVLLNLRR
jgi:hypothetical protein